MLDDRAQLALRRIRPADCQLVGEGAGLQQVAAVDDVLRACIAARLARVCTRRHVAVG